MTYAPSKSGRESRRDRAVLMLCHVAGMIDLIALPVWVGALVQHYRFNLQQAGGIVTAFLAGVVLASVYAAPRFDRAPQRLVASGGYGVAAAAFLAMSLAQSLFAAAALHALAGLAVGAALSMAHGRIGRSANPHRLFAYAGIALGASGVAFYATVPPALARHGGALLFQVIAGMMLVAALAAMAFPALGTADRQGRTAGRIVPAAWLAMCGLGAMSLNQTIMFSMLERIGIDRGFGQEAINQILISCGLVNLVPAALAGLLQHRLSAHRVMLVAPLAQLAIALTIFLSGSVAPYALAACLCAFVMIFVHTFAFGLIARLDPSGRALAATPALVMSGAAAGPFIGGTVALHAGYAGLVGIALAVSLAALACFAQGNRPRYNKAVIS